MCSNYRLNNQLQMIAKNHKYFNNNILKDTLLAKTLSSDTLLTKTLSSDTLLTKTLSSDTSLTKTLSSDTSLAEKLSSDTSLTKTLSSDTSHTKTLPSDTSLAEKLSSDTSLTKTLSSNTSLAEKLSSDTLLAKTLSSDTSLAEKLSSNNSLTKILPSDTSLAEKLSSDTLFVNNSLAEKLSSDTLFVNNSLVKTLSPKNSLTKTILSTDASSVNISSSDIENYNKIIILTNSLYKNKKFYRQSFNNSSFLISALNTSLTDKSEHYLCLSNRKNIKKEQLFIFIIDNIRFVMMSLLSILCCKKNSENCELSYHFNTKINDFIEYPDLFYCIENETIMAELLTQIIYNNAGLNCEIVYPYCDGDDILKECKLRRINKMIIFEFVV